MAILILFAVEPVLVYGYTSFKYNFQLFLESTALFFICLVFCVPIAVSSETVCPECKVPPITVRYCASSSCGDDPLGKQLGHSLNSKEMIHFLILMEPSTSSRGACTFKMLLFLIFDSSFEWIEFEIENHSSVFLFLEVFKIISILMFSISSTTCLKCWSPSPNTPSNLLC